MDRKSGRIAMADYWLMKSEPDVFGVDHLAAEPKENRRLVGCAQLSGAQLHARRHEARRSGFLLPLELCRAGHRRHHDASRGWLTRTTLNSIRKSEYFDPAATREKPRWVNVDVNASARRPS